MSRLLCKFFGHRRNIHGIRRTGSAWRSHCVHCRQPLIRISRGAWQPCTGNDLSTIVEQDPLPLFERAARSGAADQ